MLVLTRTIGQTVLIGPDVSLTLISTSRNRAQFVVTAPRDVDLRLEGPDNGFQRVKRPRAAKPESK
jgi:carbon storage regulator CsrA